MNDFTIFFSLISLGFFGGFTHCIGMCGPFVLSQSETKLKNVSIEKYSNFTKLTNLALLPYHLGRITTYSIIGVFCSIFTKNIENFVNFRIISALLLIIAALIFINLFFDGIFLNKNLLPRIRVKIQLNPIKNILSFLFKKPYNFNGYFLGIILGFIPCGLLYGAFAIVSSIQSPIIAAMAMMSFGVSTFPALFITALGGGFLFKMPEFKIFSKIIILINITLLILMAIKLIY